MELGTALAVVAFADQCLKYGNKFVKRCRSYLRAEQETVELLISIESNWVKMETQIEIIKKIAPSLNVRLQDIQSQILSQLEGKLKTASLIIEQLMTEKRDMEKIWRHNDRDIVTKMRGLGDMKASKKGTYVAKKNSLNRIVEDIEKWQARYDPTWILIMQMSTGTIDKELQEQEKKPKGEQIPIIVAAKGIRDASKSSRNPTLGNQQSIWIEADELAIKLEPIPFSSLQVCALEDEKSIALVDTMISNAAANFNSTMRNVRNLARVLAEVDPYTFGLLKCRGVIKVPRESKSALQPIVDYNFVLEIPATLTNPQSLRAILLSGTPYPLDERLDLAKKLTSSILFVHTVQFVHKNVRPETIIVFQDENSEIGAPFLAGFEHFRLEDGHTHLTGDDEWEKNIYRHPSRQGLYPEISYQMQHDIYSLGVVLLEIGLWASFVVYDPQVDDHTPSPPTRNSILGPTNTIAEVGTLKVAAKSKIAAETKTKLEQLAQKELPLRLGRKYTNIVLLCLRVLDTGSDNENDESEDGFGVGVEEKRRSPNSSEPRSMMDEDGVVIGVRYIENVLTKIQEINL
ncbi:uncharacterized protein PAC_08503 [Phialocephala subalpina]|uniref:Protein kinase domain-containing protein n=1 Tax=Phialocephala subalpina TaxID=576137 RepID=A0A1L7X0R8_9HELO|nr:uncharacterized protein PAC_08503 [Phialocephala subalpina]